MNKFISRFIILLSVTILSVAAFAGGSSPGLYYGQVPTAAQWNSYFASKLDYTPGAANTIPYWDGAGTLLNGSISGDCTSIANVFTCSHATNANTSTTATTSTNLAGGSVGSIPYQSATGTTTFIPANSTTVTQFYSSTALGGGVLQPPALISSTGTGSVVMSSAATMSSANLSSPVITGGSINNAIIGATTANTGKFTTLQATGAVTLSPASANVTISPTGTGITTISPAGSGSTIDNVAIGQTTPLAGKFNAITATGIVDTSAVSGDQFIVSNDPSPLRIGAWPTAASGGIYTLFGNQPVMQYWSHNTALDVNGNFLGRGDTGTCTVGGFAENDHYKIFTAPSNTAGTTPSFGATPTYDFNTSTGDLSVTGAYSGAGTGLTGTAASLTAGNATKLATARAINGINFDGSAAITVPATIGTSTFAALPAAASNTGVQYRVTDIGMGNSIWYSNGTQWYPVGGQVKLSADAIPIGIPPGNGTNTGLQFTNATGAFTLTTTTFQNAYTGGIWLWMPIGAFDGTNPTSANFYWAVMSTTSAGQLYTATYQAGIPTGLVQATTTAARWLTQTTGADITARSITVIGGSMGPNGMLKTEALLSYNNSAGVKAVKVKASTMAFTVSTVTTTQTFPIQSVIRNIGLQNANVGNGNGLMGPVNTPNVWGAIDFSVNQTLSITLQLAANTDFVILEGSNVLLTPGF